MDTDPNRLKPQSLSETSQEKMKKEENNSQTEKEEMVVITKKKKHGFRNFVLIVGIALAVYSVFTSNSIW